MIKTGSEGRIRSLPTVQSTSDNRLGLADRTLVINGGTLALGPQENRSA